MTDEQMDAMIRELLNTIDYDIAKQYDEKTAEEPEFVEENFDELRDIVRSYIARTKKHRPR